MTEQVKEILVNSQIIIDTCILMKKEEPFLKDTLYDLLIYHRRQAIIPKVVDYELRKNRLKSRVSWLAEEGLETLDCYYKANILNIIDKNYGHADSQILQLVLEQVNFGPVCVLTEDKALALDLLSNVNNLNSTKLNNPVYCIKLDNGTPVLWSLDDLERKLKKMNDAKYQLLSQNANHKMLLSIVFDNSASVKGEKIEIFKKALLNFQQQIVSSGLDEYVKYEVIGYQGLNATTIKDYDSNTILENEIKASGVPFVAKAVTAALYNLDKKVTELENQNFKCYRPWLVLLTDGQNFDNLDGIVGEIEMRNANKSLSYFPFLLGHNDIDESFMGLIKFKRPLLIVQNKYDELFKWIFNTIKQRIETPIDQAAQLDFSAFDGWIQK